MHGDSPTEPAPRGRPGLSHVHCCLSLLLAFSARLPPLPSALSTQQRGPVGMQVRSHSPTVQRVPPTRRRPTPVSQSRSLSAPPAGAGLPGLLLISAFTPTSLLNEQAEHGPTSGPLPLLLPLPGRLSPKVRPRAPSLLIRVSAQTALKQRGLIWPPAASLHKRPHSQHAPGH